MTKPAWVLVVDDDASDGMALFRLLEQVGHHATVSASGRAALELLRAEPFDVVLIDLTTSDGNGLFDAIQRDERLSHTPVVAISAPFDPDRLRSRVDAALALSSPRERRSAPTDP